ncbi:hypothetical protein GIB67_037724 [Kingdonia uniflora]|uniref:DFDF domain-containing protein n=1 Tax=Kingdonia uniflora TaxID=39325 RepID=A0A7J7LV26_9MAGN|nr:hypothetical protein GIB67_037724 [Kingdonia uniflora]
MPISSSQISASLPSDISSSLSNTTSLPLPNQRVKRNLTRFTTDQLKQSGLQAFSSTRTLHNEKRHMETLEASLKPSPLKPSPTQWPLLPLPYSSGQVQLHVTPFSEEFDSMAMNEKFNKDEVWGHFGQANQKNEAEVDKFNTVSSTMGDYKGQSGIPVAADIKPVCGRQPICAKDTFFDAFSYNSLSRGAMCGWGDAGFSQRMKFVTETFGDIEQPQIFYSRQFF